MAIRVKYSIMIIMNAPLLGAIFGGYLMPYQHFLCSMMLPGLGIASKLSLHLKLSASCPHRCCAIAVASLPPKTILSVFLPYSFVLPYIRKTKGRRRGKESDNERCSIEPTQALGTWGTFIGIIAKGGEWWRRMRFGSRRSFVILLPKQN